MDIYDSTHETADLSMGSFEPIYVGEPLTTQKVDYVGGPSSETMRLGIISTLTKKTKNATIFLNNKEKNSMSVMLMLSNKNGAVIFSDSRETFGSYKTNDKIKIKGNNDIIIGQMGLNSLNGFNFNDIILNEMLIDKDLNTVLNKTRKGHRLQDYIPDGKSINVFYATKNGRTEVVDIKNDDARTINGQVLCNSGAYGTTFNALISDFVSFDSDSPLDLLKEQGLFVMKTFLRLIKDYETMTKTSSIIGGEVQYKTIDFKTSM